MMALGPQGFKIERARLVAEVEKALDARIQSSTLIGMTFAVSCFPQTLTRFEWEALLSKYLSVGWKQAQYISDQRDGDYIQFSS